MQKQYDIAISYKSEIEDKAKKIAHYLEKDHWSIFFAPKDQQELLSEEISSQLYDIYKNRSRLKLLLISEGYLEGEWTSLEKRMALESTKGNRKGLLIVNYTNRITLPGELKELQYINGNRMYEDEIASIVTERLKKCLDNSVTKVSEEKEQDEHVNIMVNHGIIAGDNAHFGNIQF